MKEKLLILLFSFISFYSFSQGCIAGSAQYNAVMGNYQTRFLSGADMFWDLSGTKTFIPKGNHSQPVYASGLWIGGYYQGALRMAAATYRQNGNDFWPGPLDSATAGTSATYCYAYDTYFPIQRTQIDSQRNHLYSNNPPAAITAWPGNPANTSQWHAYAPYEDVNHNHIYDPANGDYPLAWGDRTVYQVINDRGNAHTESHTVSFGIEVHVAHYSFDCPSDSALWNTLFTHYDIINRSSSNYDSVRTAIFTDFEIGNYSDDYIGCDTALNLFYGYNGDNFDSDTNGYTGYHQFLPAFGTVLLNQKLSSFTTYAASFYPQSPPNSAGAYGCMIRGLWPTGNPMYDSADGSAGSHVTKFMFPGDPVGNTGWNEISALQPPRQVLGLGSSGSQSFAAQDTIKLDVAYVFARDYTNPGNNVSSISKLRQYVQNIRSYYYSNVTPCGSTFGISNHKIDEEPSVYPNPAYDVVNVTASNNRNSVAELVASDGRIMAVKQFSGSTQINIAGIDAGIYYLRTRSETDVFAKKIIILR